MTNSTKIEICVQGQVQKYIFQKDHYAFFLSFFLIVLNLKKDDELSLST